MKTYYVPFAAAGVTASVDVVEITAPANRSVSIKGLTIGQTTDAQDQEDEQLEYQILFVTGAAGSGGSAVTPVQAAVSFGSTPPGQLAQKFDRFDCAPTDGLLDKDELEEAMKEVMRRGRRPGAFRRP